MLWALHGVDHIFLSPLDHTFRTAWFTGFFVFGRGEMVKLADMVPWPHRYEKEFDAVQDVFDLQV